MINSVDINGTVITINKKHTYSLETTNVFDTDPLYSESLYSKIVKDIETSTGSENNSFFQKLPLKEGEKIEEKLKKIKNYRKNQGRLTLQRAIFSYYGLEKIKKDFNDLFKNFFMTNLKYTTCFDLKRKDNAAAKAFIEDYKKFDIQRNLLYYSAQDPTGKTKQSIQDAFKNSGNILAFVLMYGEKHSEDTNSIKEHLELYEKIRKFFEEIAKGASPYEEYKKLGIPVSISILKKFPKNSFLKLQKDLKEKDEDIIEFIQTFKDYNHVPENRKDLNAYLSVLKAEKEIDLEDFFQKSPHYGLKKVKFWAEKLKTTDIPLIQDFLRNYKKTIIKLQNFDINLPSLPHGDLKFLVECEKRFHQSHQKLESVLPSYNLTKPFGTYNFPEISLGNGYVLKFVKNEGDLKDLGKDQKNCIGGALYRHTKHNSLLGSVSKHGETILSVDIEPISKNPNLPLSNENFKGFKIKEMRSYENDLHENQDFAKSGNPDDTKKRTLAKKYGQDAKTTLEKSLKSLETKHFPWDSFEKNKQSLIALLSQQEKSNSFQSYTDLEGVYKQKDIWSDIVKSPKNTYQEPSNFDFQMKDTKTLVITLKEPNTHHKTKNQIKFEILCYIWENNLYPEKIEFPKDPTLFDETPLKQYLESRYTLQKTTSQTQEKNTKTNHSL